MTSVAAKPLAFAILALFASASIALSFAPLYHAHAAESGGTTVGAQSGGQTANTGTGLKNPLAGAGINSLPDLLNALLDFAITIGGIIVTIMLVFVGFKFVAAQGNSEKLTEARTMLLWTVIGALILLGAKAIEVGIVATVNSLAS
ncbi:MAG TPA: hypothetical protein VF439_02020 [Candidatus Paceibacterota bacterium]